MRDKLIDVKLTTFPFRHRKPAKTPNATSGDLIQVNPGTDFHTTEENSTIRARPGKKQDELFTVVFGTVVFAVVLHSCCCRSAGSSDTGSVVAFAAQATGKQLQRSLQTKYVPTCLLKQTKRSATASQKLVRSAGGDKGQRLKITIG